jgi:myosin-5
MIYLVIYTDDSKYDLGMQIQYNITRIEEWCKSHEIQQGADHLERLMQAAKLLQLQKNSIQDIEIMFEVCFLLNKAQVKKLITIYSTSDYENPISTEIMQEVMRRCDEGGAADESKLFLEVNANRAEDALHQVKPAITIDRYIPAWLDLPHLSAIVGMDDDLDSASTAHSKLSDMHTRSPRESMHTTRSSRSTLRSSISTLNE